jgi:hypothetical protein
MNAFCKWISPVLVLVLGACGPTGEDDAPIIVNYDAGMNSSSHPNGETSTNGGLDMGAMSSNNDGGPNNRDPDMGSGEPDMEVVSTADEVDPNCIDGMYSEALPDPNADISDEVTAYSAAERESFFLAVLDKRYPVGTWVVEGGLTDRNIDCVEQFSSASPTADGAIGDLSTVVHECGHVFNWTIGDFSTDGYGITPELTLTCSGGDATARGGETFARSLIRDDEYQSLKPDDSYVDVYLTGDPTNDEFEGGDQGFNSVLEETLQYVNSLATSYAFQEYIGGAVSSMDGILTFLWYVERYLRMARLEYPDAYAKLSEDPCWREAILTVWGRAWIMLEAAEGNDSLGIDDEELFELVRDPELLGEIQRLRDLEGC